MARIILFPGLIALLIAPAACGPRASGEDGAAADSTASAAKPATEQAADAAGASTAAESDDPEGGDPQAPEAPRRESTSTVDAALSQRTSLVLSVIAEGTIRSRRTADIRTELSGRVARVRFEEGDAVKTGQVILEIDPREYTVALDEAHSRYLEALSRLAVEEGRLGESGAAVPDSTASPSAGRPPSIEEGQAELDRLESRGEITREERIRRALDLELAAIVGGAFREEVAAARSGVATARAALERARLDLERTQIKAPFTGVISELRLTPGQQLQLNQTICRLVDNVDLEAEVGVLESDLRGLEVGRPALLVIPALADTIPVTVNVINPEVDRESRTCRVLMRLAGRGGRVRPGMFVRAAIAGQILSDRLVVPREALLTREGRSLVFKVEGDRAKWLYVTVGERNDRLVEITGVEQGGTLDAGDTVIVSNHLTLAHNAPVKVRRTIETRNPWDVATP